MLHNSISDSQFYDHLLPVRDKHLQERRSVLHFSPNKGIQDVLDHWIPRLGCGIPGTGFYSMLVGFLILQAIFSQISDSTIKNLPDPRILIPFTQADKLHNALVLSRFSKNLRTSLPVKELNGGKYMAPLRCPLTSSDSPITIY